MTTDERLDAVLARLERIEKRLAEIPTFESWAQMATRDDVASLDQIEGVVAGMLDSVMREFQDEVRYREFAEMRARRAS